MASPFHPLSSHCSGPPLMGQHAEWVGVKTKPHGSSNLPINMILSAIVSKDNIKAFEPMDWAYAVLWFNKEQMNILEASFPTSQPFHYRGAGCMTPAAWVPAPPPDSPAPEVLNTSLFCIPNTPDPLFYSQRSAGWTWNNISLIIVRRWG